MAFNYTQFFSRIGAILAGLNANIATQKQLVDGSSGRLQKILAQYAENPSLVSGISGNFSSAVSQVQGQESGLVNNINATLADQQSTLSAPNASASTILSLLVNQMVVDGQSVTPNVVSVGSVTASSGNVGNGTILLLSTNPSFPSAGPDQRMNAETVKIVCTGDQSNGYTPGGEAFSASGYASQGNINYSYVSQGSGNTTLNTCDQNGNVLTNGSFDNYNGSAFSGWTVQSLPAGEWYGQITHVVSGVESLPSPISAGTAVTAGQAITWALPTYGVIANPTVAPTLSSVAGGTIAATTYYFKVALVNASGVTLPSPEASLAVAVDYVPVVDSPSPATNATYYNVYGSTATGTETLQNASPIPIGTNWTMPNTGLVAGSAVPAANTTYAATMNLYASASPTQIASLQATGLNGSSTSMTQFVPGRAPPVTGSAGPAAAITGTVYTPGLTVYQDTNTTVPATGGGALWLEPNSGGDIVISQTLRNISPGSALAACAWLAQLNCTSGSTLSITISGLSSIPSLTIFSGDPSALTENYTLKTAAAWPTAITQNATLTIRWGNSDSAGSTAVILVDQMAIAKMTTLGYNQIAVLRGAVDFAIGDNFSFTTTNNYAGLMQSGFGQFMLTQLPSSGSPTIPDSLVA